LFDGDGVSIDTEDDTVDGGLTLTCCSFLCRMSQSSCIQLFNDTIDDDGNDADGTADGTVDDVVDGRQEGYSDILLLDSPVMIMMMIMTITIFNVVVKCPDIPFSNHQIVFQSILRVILSMVG